MTINSLYSQIKDFWLIKLFILGYIVKTLLDIKK